jgi:hypothetical protein
MKRTNSVFGKILTNVEVEIQNVKLEDNHVKIAKGGGGT